MSPSNGKPPRQRAAHSVGIIKADASETTATPATTQLPIDQIRIGERHRRDLGDLAGLAASMGQLGLLHPVVIRPDGMLIAGERRLRAAQQLGWADIPVTVVDLDEIARGEHAENAVRKDFTLSEAVAIKRALEPIERAAARERMASPEKFSDLSKGNALDKIAKATGMHRTTLAKAEAVVDAASVEPEKYGRLLADMDRTGRVNAPFKRLRVAKQAEQIRAEPPPLPGRGPYRVLVVDPPWPYEMLDADPSHRAALPYLTGAIADFCKLRVPSIAAADSVLWLWTTNHHMREAFDVLGAWGFESKTILTWAKDTMGRGDWLRGQTEHAIMAVCGSPIVTLTNQTTLLRAPVRGHSVKPSEFYDLVESLCPAPRYADLFSRYRHNDKWDCHGDEAPPPGESWAAMWARPFDFSKLAADASPDLWPDLPDCLRRAAP